MTSMKLALITAVLVALLPLRPARAEGDEAVRERLIALARDVYRERTDKDLPVARDVPLLRGPEVGKTMTRLGLPTRYLAEEARRALNSPNVRGMVIRPAAKKATNIYVFESEFGWWYWLDDGGGGGGSDGCLCGGTPPNCNPVQGDCSCRPAGNCACYIGCIRRDCPADPCLVPIPGRKPGGKPR